MHTRSICETIQTKTPVNKSYLVEIAFATVPPLSGKPLISCLSVDLWRTLFASQQKYNAAENDKYALTG